MKKKNDVICLVNHHVLLYVLNKNKNITSYIKMILF